ncbi:MAG: hypothetical protein DRR19_05380 [Candidatus Parabeggiatoa sp. nov. 1]|nr:MAG: hypothetical protein DRR19_05380 [Gammaproteobacteria bacterium]
MKHQRMGICTNVGNCALADKKEKIPITGKSGECPNGCGPLVEIKLASSLLKKGGLVAILTLFLGGGGWYLLSSKPKPTLACGPTEIKTPSGECVPKTDTQTSTIKAVLPEPEPEPSDLAKLMTKLRQEIEELKDKIQELERRGEETADLKKRLAKLENEVKAEENNDEDEVDTTPLEKGLAEIEDEVTQKLATKVPACLSSAPPELRNRFPMFFVPIMQGRTIPDHLRVWMKGFADTINETAFFIMRREVTVGEFQQYVNILDVQQKQALGNAWQQENRNALPKNNPVGSVPWWAANGYADWLFEQTGCPLTLPTYNQWIAATIRYAKPDEAVTLDTTQFDRKPKQREEKPENVVDLLGNLREWSIDECSGRAHYILGEDYKTWRANIIGEAICESSTFNTIGFRLVLQE